MSQHARNNPELYESPSRMNPNLTFGMMMESVEREMQECENAGCEGPDHKCHE